MKIDDEEAAVVNDAVEELVEALKDGTMKFDEVAEVSTYAHTKKQNKTRTHERAMMVGGLRLFRSSRKT